jgi:3-deoxy-manno-octulosonate cytidylyltransferase (CMP-KDO synthetase)
VFVATCDQEIVDYVDTINGKSVMTKDTHERCTDRTTEALLKIEEESGERVNIVLMVQGDEPMVLPEMLTQAVQLLLDDSSINVLNLMSELKTRDEQSDPNEVKVVVDLNSNALYFSREPIPSWKKGATSVPMLKQIAIIPFRRNFLLTYQRLPPTPLEIIESVDMMRVLEHGYSIKMVKTEASTYAVDTVDDLTLVQRLMGNDSLMDTYLL